MLLIYEWHLELVMKRLFFALSDAKKHLLIMIHVLCDATDLIIDDYVQQMVHNKPFEELFDDP